MIVRVLLALLLLPSIAQATTYWVSPAGGSSTCSAVDGDADPGVYMTLAQIDTSNCATAGDTVMFKAGTYTGTAKSFELIVPSGTSSSNMSSVLCEANRTCIIAFSSTAQAAMIGASNVSYYRIGAVGQGFKTDCVNVSSGSLCYGVRLALSSTSIPNQTTVIIEGNEMVRNTKAAVNTHELYPTGGYYSNVQVRYNKMMAPGTPNISGGEPPQIYLAGDDNLIEHNEILTFALTNCLGIQVYHIAVNAIIRYNRITAGTGQAGILVDDSEPGRPGNGQIYGNVLRNVVGQTASSCMTFQTGSDSSVYYNNTCDGWTNFYNIRSGATGNTLINNTCSGTCNRIPGTGNDFGGTATTTNPIITAATHYKDPTNNDYSLKAGSTQIDAGIDVGFPYNGSGRDRGAHETFVFASCEVRAASTNMVRVTFTNNSYPPLLPATGATTFTVRRNGSNNVVTGSVDRSGDGVFVIPVTTSYVGGDTVDISLSTNNITDSAMIGGDANQPYVGTLTNQSCTNNAGGPPFTFTQSAYELHDWLGSETAPVILPYGFATSGAAENFANYKVRKGGKIRIRFAVVCGGSDCPPTAFNLYRSTGGGYSQLTDSFGVSGGFKFCGEIAGSGVTNGGPSTAQLSTPGTFAPGGIMYTASAIPTVTGFNNGYKTELEYCVDVRDTAATGNVDFRVYQQDGTALNTYTVTPRLVIDEIAAGAQ